MASDGPEHVLRKFQSNYSRMWMDWDCRERWPMCLLGMLETTLCGGREEEEEETRGIVRKLTESVVLFKKEDAGGGVLTESIRRADIVEAVGKQLGIEIVEGLLDMEDEDVLTTVGTL
eukprot:jgi/Picre1/27637/NNA_000601.t1